MRYKGKAVKISERDRERNMERVRVLDERRRKQECESVS